MTWMMTVFPKRLMLLFLIILVDSFLIVTAAIGRTPCTSDLECRALVHEESLCRQSIQYIPGDTNNNDNIKKEDMPFFCTNPFASGCFHALDPEWHHNNKIFNKFKRHERVCNSEDRLEKIYNNTIDNDNDLDGICVVPTDIEYMEVQIFVHNWESVHVEAWLLQIILSEFLNVPTSIETGAPKPSYMNLYHPFRAYDGGTNLDRNSLYYATKYGDCSKVPIENQQSQLWYNDTHPYTTYIPCAHIVTEIWSTESAWDMEREKIIDPPQGLGVLGQEGWYVPKFTGRRDPSLLSYLGLQGTGNREKLAKTFLRPVTWADYCEMISKNQCHTPDVVATREPNDDWEGNRYFAEGLYTGYFHATDDNDCERSPNNCTGHIADYPCGWTSHVFQQAYHLDIAVKSNGPEPGANGYAYDSLVEIWHAANYTKSNVLMYWWSPDSLVDKFAGTDAEFTKISLPPPTQSCTENRVDVDTRCWGTLEERRGDPRGGLCDDPPNPLQKVVSKGLRDETFHPSIPEALRSPAFDVAKSFSLTSEQLAEIFDYSKQYPDPREALCQWAVDNKEWIEGFVPTGYPRTVHEGDKFSPLQFAALLVGTLAVLLCFAIGYGVYRYRDCQVMKSAQIEFLMLLLGGLFVIAVGAITISIPANNGSCIASIWLINLGYTIELAPLLVKISAINRLISAARGHRRVLLHRNDLFRTVAIICLGVVIFLILWTTVDPPTAQKEYYIVGYESNDQNDNTHLEASSYCHSRKEAWGFLAIGWNCAMLLSGSVLAFQSGNIRMKDFNESLTVGLIVYSQTIFVVLRIIIRTVLSGSVYESALDSCESLIFSTDTIVTSSIYFIPKFRKRQVKRSASSYMNFLTSSIIDQVKSAGRLAPTPSANFSIEDNSDSSSDNGAAKPDQEQESGCNLAICPVCGYVPIGTEETANQTNITHPILEDQMQGLSSSEETKSLHQSNDRKSPLDSKECSKQSVAADLKST